MTHTRPTPLLIAGAAIPLLLAAGTVVLTALTAHRVIHPQRARPTQIFRVDGDTVALSSNPLTRHPGVLGLLHDNERHLALLTPQPPENAAADSLNRTLQGQPQPPVHPGPGRATGNVYAGPQDVDERAFEVTLETDVGPAPAWVFPADPTADTWLVHLHGSLSGREGALRSVAAARASGLPSIVPAFRGDPEGPLAPRGAFMLGQTEWQDIEPALAYAEEHGARQIVLIGWSNGASMAFRLATSSRHRGAITGIVAISPVLDWSSTIRLGVKTTRLPAVIATLAMKALGARGISAVLGAPEPLRFQELAWTAAPRPTLLIHSQGDRTAPYTDSLALHFREPNNVVLLEMAPAPHALEWNTNPRRFAEVLTNWLDGLHGQGTAPPSATSASEPLAEDDLGGRP